jgi:hypothetical protein
MMQLVSGRGLDFSALRSAYDFPLQKVKIPTFAAKNAAKMGHPAIASP